MNLEQTLLRLEAAKGDPAAIALAAADIVLAAENPNLAPALEAAAVPHWFDESMLRALLGAESPTASVWFEHLTGLAVVERFRAHKAWNVHDVTRQALRRRLASSDEKRFRELSRRAASLVGGHEASHVIERLYHLLSADPDAGCEALRRVWKRWDRFGQIEPLQALARNLDELRDQALLGGRARAYVLVCLISVRLERTELAASYQLAQEAVDLITDTGDELGRFDAYAALGDVLRTSGRTTEALAAYQQARSSLEHVYAEDADFVELAHERSELHTKTGRTFQERGELVNAHLHFDASMALRREAFQADPDNELKKVELAVSYADLGDVLLPTDRALEAEAQYVEALRLFDRMTGEVIGAQRLDENIGRIRLRLGHAAWVHGAPADAMEHFRAAVEVFRRCVEADPEHFGWRNDLAHAYHQIGGVDFRRGDLGATDEKFEGAREIWADLSERDPTNPSWKNALACLHSDFGDLREKQARHDDALREHKVSVKLHKELANSGSSRPQEKRNYADALTSLGTFHLRGASELEDDQQKGAALANAWEALSEANPCRVDRVRLRQY
jgi:tetratricopeptide (TPR) repeat protein